jgi:hypothetical protein
MAEVRQRLFSITETMTILGRSRSSVWRDIKAGRLAVVRIAGSTRVTADSVDLLVANGAPLVEADKRPRIVARAKR